ncbi:MAG: lipid A deacylase LpxR family protein [Thioalkalispiraceae bacterium]|jgi:hypothetical protein
MLSTRSSFLVFCVFNLLVSASYAQETSPARDLGIGVYVDQDLFIPFTNEDRDYTMGLAFEFFWSKDKGLYPLDDLVRKAGKWLDIDESDKDIVYSFMLGTLAFTPDDLSDPDPIYDDRPYSSLIYLSNKRVRADSEDALAAEVAIGLLGTGLAYEVQSEFHDWYRDFDNSDEPVEPMGWDNQISDGGELTFRVSVSHSRLYPQFSIPGRFDISSTVGLSLGFQTNASFSGAVRFGSIKSPFWSLPYDPVKSATFLPSKPRDQWYFWSALRVHLIGYDALLQGQFRDSEVTYASDEIEHLVYDGAFGFTMGIGKSQFTFSANTKTSELKHTDRTQTWGSVNYIYHF